MHHKVFEDVGTDTIYSFACSGLNLHPHGCVTDDQRYFHMLSDRLVFLNPI